MKTDMRITVTKRMLREGLLRCMESKPISKIKISDLCRESGINRATFYNHYDTPVDILHELAMEYASQIESIYEASVHRSDSNDEKALKACLEYLFERKSEIKILFSENTESCMSDFSLEIINKILKKKAAIKGQNMPEISDALLYAVARASAVYSLIQICFTMDIDKTPEELVVIIKNTLREEPLF